MAALTPFNFEAIDGFFTPRDDRIGLAQSRQLVLGFERLIFALDHRGYVFTLGKLGTLGRYRHRIVDSFRDQRAAEHYDNGCPRAHRPIPFIKGTQLQSSGSIVVLEGLLGRVLRGRFV